LSAAGFAAMLCSMSLPRRVFVLLLGAFLALGMSLPAVQAAGMPPASMSMTSGMGVPGHCKDCGDSGTVAKEMGSCSSGCAAPVLAVLPQTSPTKVAPLPTSVIRQDSLLPGRAFSPDPGPPRAHDNG
jgi:hypothetical protein